MEEKEIYKALGLEMPRGQEEAPEGAEDGRESAQEQEGQQGREPESGGNDQDEPEDGQEATGEGPDLGDGQEGSETPEDSGERSLAGQEQAQQGQDWQTQARIQAAVRQAVTQERARQQAMLGRFFQTVNLRDPVTGEIVRDMEGFEAYNQAAETRRLQRNLAEGKLTPEDIDALIRRRLAQREEQPQRDAFQDAPPVAQQAAEAPPETGQASQVTEEQVAAELAEIHRLDPAVNSLEDILKGPERNAFVSAVRRGNSFLDAFRLASFDRLQQRRQAEAAQRAAQAERNRSRGKEHMVPAESRGQGAAEVPADILELYREIMPNASAEEIQKHYNKFKRGVK